MRTYERATSVPMISMYCSISYMCTCTYVHAGCSRAGQFEAGLIFEAHVAVRSDSTIHAHKSLPTYAPLGAGSRCNSGNIFSDIALTYSCMYAILGE